MIPGHLKVVKFGTFEFDLRRQELRKRGFRIKMSASQMRLLALFIERPGELISRDDITSCLWTDPRNVDVHTGINTAINRLRTHLHDDPAKPAFIETVIGLGYRFIATVESADSLAEPVKNPKALAKIATSTPAQPAPAPPAEHPGRALAWSYWPWAAAAFAFLLMTTVIVVRHHRATIQTSAGPPKPPKLPTLPNPLYPVTLNNQDDPVSAEAVAPDGQAVAYADRSGVSVHFFGAGTERLLASLPSFEVSRLAWLPDGAELLMSGTDRHTHQQQVWQLPLQGSHLRLVAEDADLATVAPDGNSIAYTRHQNTEVWVASADGQSSRELIAGGDHDSFSFLLWSPNSTRLAVELHTTGSPQDRWAFESVDAQSGKVLDREENLRLDSGYQLSDGRLVYLINTTFDSMSGHVKILTVQTDHSTGHFLSAPQVVQDLDEVSRARSLSASADGRRLALVLNKGNSDVFVADLRFPGPTLEAVRRLTHNSPGGYPHSWTADDNAVITVNSVAGKFAVFEQALDGSEPRLLAELPKDAAMAETTPDGRWILFIQFVGKPLQANAIFRVPASGGAPEQVPISGPIEEFHCSRSALGACVLRETFGKQEFRYYALDPVHGIGKELARTPWQPNLLGDWGLSPDGLTVSVANHDSAHPGIQLVHLGTSPTRIDTLPLTGHGTLLDANWAQDERGLFVECRTDAGLQLLYFDLAGHAKVLRESPILIWGVPSRDGKKLAFPGFTTNSNVWAGDVTP